MAWSDPTWKILRDSQSQFLSGKVRYSSYTSTLGSIKTNEVFSDIYDFNFTN